MTARKVSKLNSWFEERIAQCERRGSELLADDRADEAMFEKVRANVYGIFRTVLDVAVKSSGGDGESVRSFFVKRAEVIPSGWAASYEKAAEHGDTVKMQIERIKLDTIDEIKEYFAKVWEEAE